VALYYNGLNNGPTDEDLAITITAQTDQDTGEVFCGFRLSDWKRW